MVFMRCLLWILILGGSNAFAKSTFEYKIVQNDRVINPDGHQYYLKSAPFVFEFLLKDTKVVQVNVALDSKNFETAVSNQPFNGEHPFKMGTGMADYKFNRDQSLIIKGEAHNYLYYFSPGNHRCDPDSGPQGGGAVIRCLRTIADPEFLRHHKLYIVLRSEKKQADGSYAETQRNALILNLKK